MFNPCKFDNKGNVKFTRGRAGTNRKPLDIFNPTPNKTKHKY